LILPVGLKKAKTQANLMSMGHLLYIVSFLEQAMDGAFNNDHSKELPQVRDASTMD
jgi:hypothetical protein